MKRFNPSSIEPKWQKIWHDTKLYNAKDFDKSRPKFVMLTEFPYPSGDGLHLGHVREYTLGDILARYKRMLGHNVLYPMGYDAFGLPTENYAIKNNMTPQDASDQNIGNFQRQFEMLGFSIDWDRAVRTDDPNYYKWTQWLFLQFFKAGLAFQNDTSINWCPFCKTGLANEEVVNGRHERCDNLVEKKRLKQWILKITEYADKLIDGLNGLDYPSRIADQQINWIGRSKGAEVKFSLSEGNESITVFTTRIDTIFGATFLVVAPEHEILSRITTPEQRDAVNTYVKAAAVKDEIERQNTDRQKTGVFTGSYAINPATKQPIPIWAADYVLPGYGTGAIMAVPAHDDRDLAFANAFELPVVKVIEGNEEKGDFGEGVMVDSGQYTGLTSAQAREQILDDLSKSGLAEAKINYRLRDWIFSRQHYWGEPIPIIHCDEHGPVAVPDDQLPVTLPNVKDYHPTDDGRSPLASATTWVNTNCPTCGKPARRETDTMPNWAGSSWYYLRYFDSKNDRAFADAKKLDYWGQVDLYLGGMEHTTLHLLYSRFWQQFLHDQKLVPFSEPYKARRGQGIILAADGSKMSKSKGNVINPNQIIEQGYGADALRAAIAFLAPYDQTTPWNPEGVAGTYRFLNRIWTLVDEFTTGENAQQNNTFDTELTALTHKTIKKVTADLQDMAFNTAVAALMEYVNSLYKLKVKYAPYKNSDAWSFAVKSLLQLVAPFAPHMAEELWNELGHQGSIHVSSWPAWDEKYLVSATANIVVQVNGKLRANLIMPADASREDVEAAALKDENVNKFVTNPPKKVVYVPGRLINFVV